MANDEGPGRVPTPGEQLRKLRQDSGLTRSQLAAAIGYSASYLRGIETGHRKLSPEIRARVCMHLKVSFDDLQSTRELAASA